MTNLNLNFDPALRLSKHNLPFDMCVLVDDSFKVHDMISVRLGPRFIIRGICHVKSRHRLGRHLVLAW